MKKLLHFLMYIACATLFVFSVVQFASWRLINGGILLFLAVLLMPCCFFPISRRARRFRFVFYAVLVFLAVLSFWDFPTTPIRLKKRISDKGLTAVRSVTLTNLPTQTVVYDTPTPSKAPTDTPPPVSEEPFLSVICLDVGQGDATLFRFHGEDGSEHFLMLDGGDRGTSSFVVACLKKLGVTSLDFVVCTHYDADHCYGLNGCLEALSDRNTVVYCPDYVADTYTYTSFQKHLSERRLTAVHPSVGDVFYLGACKITVVGPRVVSDIENNNSIALLFSYEGCSFLFTGDSEKDEERDIVDSGLLPDSVDVYHVGHHGSYSASSDYLLSSCSPHYAVISVGADNAYEHPHDVTLSRLQKHGCSVIRTDLSGEITFEVRNGVLSVSTER